MVPTLALRADDWSGDESVDGRNEIVIYRSKVLRQRIKDQRRFFKEISKRETERKMIPLCLYFFQGRFALLYFFSCYY